jgi:Skp family chaperone for outer membrane proteins
MKMMRTLCPTLLLLALLAPPGLIPAARAQTAPTRIATVDILKLRDGFWKTKVAYAQLDKRKLDLNKELKDMADGMKKAQTNYEQLLTQASDPTLSDQERDRKKLAVSDAIKDINNSKYEYDQFSRQAQVQFEEQVKRMNSGLLTEIQTAVSNKAKVDGYSLVLNAAGDSVVYSKGDGDLTSAVLAQLNAGAPIDLTPATGTNQISPLIPTPTPTDK